MPNRASHAGHEPQRTCVVCRNKGSQSDKLRFVLVNGKVIYDMRRRLTGRGRYICDDDVCIEGVTKWLRKQGRRLRRRALKK